MFNKLENPQRAAELNPIGTLRQMELGHDDTFCDIGAGTGLFTFAAPQVTSGMIYAVEASRDMLDLLYERNNNPHIIMRESVETISDGSIDMALLSTVLHEIDNIPKMIQHIGRILKDGGRVTVIEFHKTQTPVGPPVDRRLSPAETGSFFTEAGFSVQKEFTLGDNFYGIVFCRQ